MVCPNQAIAIRDRFASLAICPLVERACATNAPPSSIENTAVDIAT